MSSNRESPEEEAAKAADPGTGPLMSRRQSRPSFNEDVPEPEQLPPLDSPQGHLEAEWQEPPQPSPWSPSGAPGAPDTSRMPDRTSSTPPQASADNTYPPPPERPQPPRRPEPQPWRPGPGTGPGPGLSSPAHPQQQGRPPGSPQQPGALMPPQPDNRPQQPSAQPQGQPFQYRAHFTDSYPQQTGEQKQDTPSETAEALNAETLVSSKRQGPSKGWRKALHSATFGLISPRESAAELRRRELTARARTHVAGGHHRVAVLSLKGGVGKTTTTVALGSMLASLRGDRILAVDANPDRGTLSDKVRLETAATIRDLLNEKETVSRYADIRGFTSQAVSRLEILASDRDPAVSEAFSENDYREVSRILEHYYSICLTDCGTGLLHSAMRGVLGLADQVVLVSSASVDGARSASATLDWLEAHQYGYLVRGAVVVLSMVRTDGKSSVDLDRLEQHFSSRCRAVVRVPWDSHLEEGAEVDLERLAPATRDAYLRLAATVGEAFAWPR